MKALFMTTKKLTTTTTINIAGLILVIRNHRVLIDADLASLYGVTTKRLNEQVKRNIDRFPSDFMFQLTVDEKNEVVANRDHLARLKFSKTNPPKKTPNRFCRMARR